MERDAGPEKLSDWSWLPSDYGLKQSWFQEALSISSSLIYFRA